MIRYNNNYDMTPFQFANTVLPFATPFSVSAKKLKATFVTAPYQLPS